MRATRRFRVVPRSRHHRSLIGCLAPGGWASPTACGSVSIQCLRCHARNAPPLTTENQLRGVVVDALDHFLQFAERPAAVVRKGFVLLEAGIGETHQPGRNLVGGRRARPRYRGCGQGRFSGSLMVPGSLTPRDRRARFADVSPIPPRWRPYRTRHCPAGCSRVRGPRKPQFRLADRARTGKNKSL